MRFCAICNEGFEDLVADEMKRRSDSISVTKEGRSYVMFECDPEEAIRFAYVTQSAKKILRLLSLYSVKEKTEIVQNAEDIDFSSIDGSFCVRCSEKSHEKALGSVVHSKLENPVVDMSAPENLIYFHKSSSASDATSDVVVGVDMTAQDLSKRGYKIFSHPSSIKGTLAYFMVALSGYSGEGVFLDPCSGSGTICAEAAYLVTGISIRFFEKDSFGRPMSLGKGWSGRGWKEVLEEYDRSVMTDKSSSGKSAGPSIFSYDVDLQAVNSAKKNLKIGGIDSYVSVARGDIDWLETKFEESSVDFVVSNPPHYSKHNMKKNDKFFDKFFYQVEYVLSEKGKVVILTNSERPIEISARYGFTGVIERRFQLGSSEHLIISFTK